MRRAGGMVAVCLVILAGCATGEQVDVVIPSPPNDSASTNGAATVSAGSGLRVVVKPFDDARMDRTHLGSRNHFFGSTSYFDLPKGTAGEAVAKARARDVEIGFENTELFAQLDLPLLAASKDFA